MKTEQVYKNRIPESSLNELNSRQYLLLAKECVNPDVKKKTICTWYIKIEDGSLVMQEEDASKSRKPSVYYRCSYEFYQEFLERNRDGFQETEWLLDLNENNYSQYIDKLKANGALYLYIPRPVGKSIERPETDKDYVFIPYGFMTIAFAGVSVFADFISVKLIVLALILLGLVGSILMIKSDGSGKPKKEYVITCVLTGIALVVLIVGIFV